MAEAEIITDFKPVRMIEEPSIKPVGPERSVEILTDFKPVKMVEEPPAPRPAGRLEPASFDIDLVVQKWTRHRTQDEDPPQEDLGNVLWPLRVSLSGKEKSPDPFILLSVLGKETSINRIKKVIDTI